MGCTFNVYVPSYKRYSDKIRIYDYLEYCTYVVRKSEEELYRKAGIENLLAVEDEEIDSIHKVHQWLIDKTPEDVICIVDDDGWFEYRKETSWKMTKEEASSEIERIAQCIVDLKLGFACTDANPNLMYYDAEFRFKGPVGGCKWVNKKCFKAVVDEKSEYNFDYDLELQELLHNRVILKPVYFIDCGGMDTNKGGAQVEKTEGKRRDGQLYMKMKWGKCFWLDRKSNKAGIKVKR